MKHNTFVAVVSKCYIQII